MTPPVPFHQLTSLVGKVCLVTGAGQGLGAAMAWSLAQAGAQVMLTDRYLSAARQTSDDIVAAGHQADATRLEVTDEGQWQQAVARAVERYGGLDVLVNNAGVFLGRPLMETTLAEFRSVTGPNLEGVFLGTKHGAIAMADPLRRQRGSASIINLSSTAGLVGSAGASVYCMSKGGVRLFTKAAALELAPLGIRVNSVHPSLIRTEMGEQVMDRLRGGGAPPAEAWRQAAEMVPLGRVAQPQDIASAVVYLASDASAFMTGSETVIDGGITAR